jgi:hypothetical protein
MTEAYRQNSHLSESFSEREIRQTARAEWKSYMPEIPEIPTTRLMFFDNMRHKFPHRFENPDDIIAMGIAASGDKIPTRDKYAYLHSPLYFAHPYKRFCATLAQTVHRLGLDEKVKEAEIKGRKLDIRNPDPTVIAEIAAVYYPIYEEMRVEGYSQYDIVE